MARPDAPSPSAFLALADVDYKEDAWERKVDRWTIAFSLRRSEDDIRDKQFGLFKNNFNNVCRETGDVKRSLFPTDYYQNTLYNLITISRYDTLYGFCQFGKDEDTVTVEAICTAENSFTGTGTLILALLTQYARAFEHERLVISQPLDKAKPFYKKLGFEECDGINEMEMSLYDESDGVHFAPMEEMRGTKRPRSDRLMLLVS